MDLALNIYLAFATHSMVTSEVPVTTLVFLGGMMMVGAMGSAGPPTSGQTGRKTDRQITDNPTKAHKHGE